MRWEKIFIAQIQISNHLILYFTRAPTTTHKKSSLVSFSRWSLARARSFTCEMFMPVIWFHIHEKYRREGKCDGNLPHSQSHWCHISSMCFSKAFFIIMLKIDMRLRVAATLSFSWFDLISSHLLHAFRRRLVIFRSYKYIWAMSESFQSKIQHPF